MKKAIKKSGISSTIRSSSNQHSNIKNRKMTSKDADILIDIRERLVAIETHLKDMNGRLIRHDKFITEKCPKQHINLNSEISEIKENLAKTTTKQGIVIGVVSGVGGAALTLIVSILVFGISNIFS